MNNMDTLISQIISGGLIALLIAIIGFLICRELFCWYFKINKRVALLSEIRDLLAAQHIEPAISAPLPIASGKFCIECGAAVVDNGSAFCAQCGVKL